MTQDPGPGSPMSERMQSLLSRAVEDQLSEQRQLAGVLTEVRGQLNRLGAQLEAARGGGNEQLEQLVTGVTADVRDAVRLLGERMDVVARLVGERGRDLSELRAAVEELRETVTGHTSALDGMTNGLNALPAFGARIESLQAGVEQAADRMRGLEEVGGAIAAVQSRTDSVDVGLRELRQAVATLATRAGEVPTREDLRAALEGVSTTMSTADARLARLETALPSLLERLDALADTAAASRAALDAVAEQLPAADGSGAGGDIEQGQRLAALEARLDEIAGNLTSLAGRQALPEDDPARERLDALHAALLGPQGVHAKVEALVEAAGARDDEADTERVRRQIADAVAASEQRLAAHMDEAVMALAEVLLRKRGRPGRGSVSAAVAAAVNAPAPPAAPPPAPVAGPLDDTAPDEGPSDEDPPGSADEGEGDHGDQADVDPTGSDLADDAGSADDGDVADDGDDVIDVADAGDEGDDAESAAGDSTAETAAFTPPWQIPSAPPEPAPSNDVSQPAPPVVPAKRKPWWRPGG